MCNHTGIMTAHLEPLDIFLNSKDVLLKDEAFDMLDGVRKSSYYVPCIIRFAFAPRIYSDVAELHTPCAAAVICIYVGHSLNTQYTQIFGKR